jgi:hypothetical protein
MRFLIILLIKNFDINIRGKKVFSKKMDSEKYAIYIIENPKLKKSSEIFKGSSENLDFSYERNFNVEVKCNDKLFLFEFKISLEEPDLDSPGNYDMVFLFDEEDFNIRSEKGKRVLECSHRNTWEVITFPIFQTHLCRSYNSGLCVYAFEVDECNIQKWFFNYIIRSLTGNEKWKIEKYQEVVYSEPSESELKNF